jgi:hypothetical protein
MAKKDLKALMNARLDEAMKANQERNANTVDRKINWDIESDFEEATGATSEASSWDVSIPNDVSEAGTEVYNAPTANPKRPRAYTIAYNSNTNTLVIIMRSGAWWQYNDVNPSVWMGLKGSPSTNDYLSVIEANCSSHHAADVNALSAGTKERLSYTASIASRVQQGNLPTFDETYFGSKE